MPLDTGTHNEHDQITDGNCLTFALARDLDNYNMRANYIKNIWFGCMGSEDCHFHVLDAIRTQAGLDHAQISLQELPADYYECVAMIYGNAQDDGDIHFARFCGWQYLGKDGQDATLHEMAIINGVASQRTSLDTWRAYEDFFLFYVTANPGYRGRARSKYSNVKSRFDKSKLPDHFKHGHGGGKGGNGGSWIV